MGNSGLILRGVWSGLCQQSAEGKSEESRGWGHAEMDPPWLHEKVRFR